jgi:8-oxo-dGTP pyrophosphatase MutT (NUDIX family)
MPKVLTLTLIQKDNQLLLGLKKRGFGMGKWNGFGGKPELGETIIEAAAREVYEECNLVPKDLVEVGLINFSWQNKQQDLEVHVFKCLEFSGEIEESEEMKPAWFSLDQIPYNKMWDDDNYWLPLFLANKKFEADFVFDDNDKVIKHEIREK